MKAVSVSQLMASVSKQAYQRGGAAGLNKEDSSAIILEDGVEHAEFPAVIGTILDKIVGPHMIGVIGARP